MGKCLFLRKGETHTAPISDILASDLAVGSSVYLMENGTAAEYLVVNQGIPSNSTLYDASCNGTWLLRKDIYTSRQWNSSLSNDYANSTIHSYLNSTFLSLFDANIQSVIKQVKIPYRAGSGSSKAVTSGRNGLSAKIFLPSAIEVSLSFSSTTQPVATPYPEGAVLSYFSGCGMSNTSAAPKRVATLNGGASIWFLRSPSCYDDGESYINDVQYVLCVYTNGACYNYYCNQSYGIRPALILPSNALFDKNTLILKGVA